MQKKLTPHALHLKVITWLFPNNWSKVWKETFNSQRQLIFDISLKLWNINGRNSKNELIWQGHSQNFIISSPCCYQECYRVTLIVNRFVGDLEMHYIPAVVAEGPFIIKRSPFVPRKINTSKSSRIAQIWTQKEGPGARKKRITNSIFCPNLLPLFGDQTPS